MWKRLDVEERDNALPHHLVQSEKNTRLFLNGNRTMQATPWGYYAARQSRSMGPAREQRSLK